MPILKEWEPFFKQEQEKDYWAKLQINIKKASINHKIYPEKQNIFSLFKLVKPEDVKVVIIGQDPYHGDKQANGIAFSVSNEVIAPPSLKNIFNELKNDLDIDHFSNNDLSKWVEQGVFLINTSLTVNAGEPNSHKDFGWNEFVNNCLNYLNAKKTTIVYCLFGKYALNAYNNLNNITEKKVVIVGHPSPYSYEKYFKGTKPFSKINKILKFNNLLDIDWSK